MMNVKEGVRSKINLLVSDHLAARNQTSYSARPPERYQDQATLRIKKKEEIKRSLHNQDLLSDGPDAERFLQDPAAEF